MNIGRIIPHINFYGRPRMSQDGAFKSTETSRGIFYNSQDLSGSKEFEFYITLINLFDEAIIQDNLHVLSIEQQRLLETFFTEADTIMPPDGADLNTYPYEFSKLTKQINRLDEFLGSFFGDEDEEFSRYGQKFVHTQRQPFSQKYRTSQTG